MSTKKTSKNSDAIPDQFCIFLSDPGPILVYACHSHTDDLVENWMSWPKYADDADYVDYADCVEYPDSKIAKPNLPNETTQTCKANLPNQTKLTQPSLLNPTYQTKLLVKVVNAWVRSAFGNVYSL